MGIEGKRSGKRAVAKPGTGLLGSNPCRGSTHASGLHLALSVALPEPCRRAKWSANRDGKYTIDASHPSIDHSLISRNKKAYATPQFGCWMKSTSRAQSTVRPAVLSGKGSDLHEKNIHTQREEHQRYTTSKASN